MTREQRTQQRRDLGDELWRQRFDEFGLSEYFKFIKRDWTYHQGRRALIKCKTCGCEWLATTPESIFKRKLRVITCPECGQRSDGNVQWTKSCADEAMQYYLDGHTQKETADHFGISVIQFENMRALRNIQKTPEQRADSWSINIRKGGAIASKKAFECANIEIRAHLEEAGFECVEFCNDGNVKIQCKSCGGVFVRSRVHAKNGNIVCPACYEKETALRRLKREAERQKEIQERKERREAERIQKNPLGLSDYQLSVQKKMDVVHTCEVCGKQYTIRERMERGEIKYCADSGCCSVVCNRKRSRRKQRIKGFPKNHLHRAHKYGCDYESGITLEKVIERDGLRCAICGEMCNPDDHEWTEYFGPTSPTIDHIIPMSKGGGHTWDNVQIAHALCNSKKGAEYEAS